MERELFICSCENTEHQIVFSWFEDDDVANVYATIHLRKKSFWTRLKYGIKYIFGYQSRYGAFDEFIFNPNDARKLKKIARWLTNAKVGGKCIIPVTDESENTPHCGLDVSYNEAAWEAATRKNTSAVINAINENIVEQTAKTLGDDTKRID